MVKVVKSVPAFPNGISGVKMKFPMWNSVPSINPQKLEGVFRGDFLYFSYKARDSNKDKNINNNPLIIFEGVDQNGNIVGVNLMFFNQFIDPKTGKKEVNNRYINSVLETMQALRWNDIYKTGIRNAYLPFIKKNLPLLFGKTLGFQMDRFWRTYKIGDIADFSNITIESALDILSSTNPTYVKATKTIE